LLLLGNDKFHKGKACPKLFDMAIKAMNNEKLNVCPFCFEVYLKDDKCAHVKCVKCKNEFCFECSCPRQPTLVHGNHYHRKDCKFYFDYKKKDQFDANCPECKRLGKLC